MAEATLLEMIGAAALTSVFADGIEHYRLYRRTNWTWPSDLPLSGVVIGSIMRASLAAIGLVILSEFVDAINTLSGAAVVGFALPQAVELFFGGSAEGAASDHRTAAEETKSLPDASPPAEKGSPARAYLNGNRVAARVRRTLSGLVRRSTHGS